MFKISKLADYAVILLTVLAKTPKTRLSSLALKEKTSIPRPTVSKILKQLNEAGLLFSTQGTLGGYKISKNPSSITLYDIISAFDGELALTQCTQSVDMCSKTDACHLQPHWAMVNEKLHNLLLSISLEDMMRSDHSLNERKIKIGYEK